MGLGVWFRQAWKLYPESVIMGSMTIALAPFGIWAAYKIHKKPWHYRREYTVVRDDDPYAKVLEEAYKNFVPHKPPS
uniref:Putative secreted protein n=1 Tax=Amblyomma aureolatum TaxID=187763 RepID=A0A1E1WYL4_9ACAR